MSSYLIDTSVLVRLLLPHDPRCPVATSALDELKRRGEAACVAPQNLIEFWSVATRPVEVNGLGMAPDQVATEVDRIVTMFRLLDEPPHAYRRWRRLVEACAVRGRQVHDAHLVAVMLAHGVDHILTFNVDDFARYPDVVAVGPGDLAGPVLPPERGEQPTK